MPVPDVEQLRKREGSLRNKIAEMGESADPIGRRRLRKSLKRVQRKRREILASTERFNKAAKTPAAAAGGEATPRSWKR